MDSSVSVRKRIACPACNRAGYEIDHHRVIPLSKIGTVEVIAPTPLKFCDWCQGFRYVFIEPDTSGKRIELPY